jgi:hypothetical protein
MIGEGVGDMLHNYWLGIMAVAFALALALWIVLVFNADRHPGGRQQEHHPMREVMGGEFVAKEGGRQLVPHFGEPLEPFDEPAQPPAQTGDEAAPAGQAEPQVTVPEQSRRVPSQPEAASVPAQSAAPEGEQAEPATSGSRSGRRWPFGSRR